MSFLGDIVKSIGTAPPPPPKPPSRPSSANTNRANANAGKPTPRPPFQQTPSGLSGIKRKVEDDDGNRNGKAGKSSVTSGPGNEVRRSSAAPLHAPKPKAPAVSRLDTGKASDHLGQSPTKGSASPAAGTKPAPSKGSYADLMARAKEAAEQRAQNSIGVIKHQDTVKPKTTKFAERRKEEQERVKAQKYGNGKQAKPEERRSTSPQKKDEPHLSKSAKSASKVGYKGTMGISTSRQKPHKGPAKKSRYDEYLGTDEEEDSEMDVDEDEGGYGSDGSSDMEAGFDDVEGEERLATRRAKEDDAKELALENELKREKEERRRRLMALSNKRK